MSKEVKENPHAIIMREMSKYLDLCKLEKMDCQCTCLLEHNPNETNEYKKFKFTYQCDSQKNKNLLVKQIMQTNMDIKIEDYIIKK